METKPALQSKTLWLNFIAAASALFAPNVQSFIAAHPTEVMVGFALLNMALRAVTKGKIEIA